MNVDIEVIDQNEGRGLLFMDELVSLNTSPIRVSSVRDMVAKVSARLMTFVQMDHFYILGHGTEGVQYVGCGPDGDVTGNRSLQVDKDGELLGDGGIWLPHLRPLVKPTCVVTLGGCWVGGGTEGPKLLSAVSRTLGGVEVQAGTDSQRLRPGLQGNIISCRGAICGVHPTTWRPITWPF